MKLKTFLIGVLLTAAAALPAFGVVTLPYTFTAGQPIAASQVNANDQALRDGINNHTSATNPHNTTLAQILSQGNSCGATSINFNGTNGVNFEVENLASDPTCNSGATGRLIWNTVDELFKVCNGTSFVSIAGSGVNTLQSVLSAGNSAGSTDIDLNHNELLNARVELRTSDPSAENGRIYYRTDNSELKVCNGSVCTALGGAQSLASTLVVGNSAGSTNIDFNLNQAVNMLAEKLSSDPSGTEARVYYNTTSDILKFYNGASWKEIGNTQGLDDVIAIDNDAGGNIDMENFELERVRMENLASSPGNGHAGRLWFNTGSSLLTMDDGSANRVFATLDNTQTLTNKTISGSSNTITNVQDSALSSNVMLRDGVQSISGAKTFASGKVVVSDISTPSGAKHILTDGLSDDTITLNNAVQTLNSKTLGAASMAGNMDFNNYQATEFRIENRGTNPVVGNAGRMWYQTSTGEIRYDTGSGVRVLSSSGAPANDPWSVEGNSGLTAGTNFMGTTDAVDVVFKTNSTEVLRLTSGGSIDTTLGAGVCHADASGIISSSTIVNADVDAAAAIARSKLATGTNHALLVNNSSGVMSELGPLTNGQLLIGSTGAAASAASITGTANQITMTAGAGSITLSTPQNIHTAATPTFAGMTLSAFGAGVVHSNGSGLLSSSAIVNADIDAAAAIAYSKLNLTGSIVNADVNASAAIDRTKIASGTNYRILANNSSGVMSENAALTSTRIPFADANGQLSDSSALTWGSSTLGVTGNIAGTFTNDTATGANQTLTSPATMFIRLTSGTLTSIDGIPAPSTGKTLVLINATGVSVSINNETGATAANRILTGANGNFTFQDTAAVFLVYDLTSSRWRMIGGAGSSKAVSTFSGTSITPASGSNDQTWVYNGGSAQTFTTTGFGTISSLSNGTKFTIMGSSDTNTITIQESDISDGRLMNGDIILKKGKYIIFEYNSTLGRMVEVGRSQDA